MRLTRRSFLGSLVVIAIRVPQLDAQFGFGLGATEITQLLNHAELVTQIEKQVQSITVAIQTYRQMVTAGMMLGHMQWSNAQQDLLNVAEMVQIGQSISFSLANIDQRFSNAYPGFATPSSLPYFKQYRTWAQTALDTVKGTLRGTGMSYKQFQNEQLYAAYLQSQATSAQGQMQALSVGNQVNVETLKSIQKLREIFLTDMQSKQTFQAYNLQKDMQQQNLEHSFFAPNKAGRDGIGW